MTREYPLHVLYSLKKGQMELHSGNHFRARFSPRLPKYVIPDRAGFDQVAQNCELPHPVLELPPYCGFFSKIRYNCHRKMIPDRPFCLADLHGDHPEQPITEKNPCFDRYGRVRKTAILLLALLVPHVSKKAQNGNQGAIQVYSIFRQVPVTGLIGAFLITFFRILNGRAQNPKYTILTGGKPALLFPIGRRICFGITHNYR